MAPSDLPNGKFRCFPRWSLWSGQGGGGWGSPLCDIPSGCCSFTGPLGEPPLPLGLHWHVWRRGIALLAPNCEANSASKPHAVSPVRHHLFVGLSLSVEQRGPPHGGTGEWSFWPHCAMGSRMLSPSGMIRPLPRAELQHPPPPPPAIPPCKPVWGGPSALAPRSLSVVRVRAQHTWRIGRGPSGSREMRWERVLWTGRGGVRGCVAVPWAGAGLLSALPSVLRAGLLLLREPLRRHVNLQRNKRPPVGATWLSTPAGRPEFLIFGAG